MSNKFIHYEDISFTVEIIHDEHNINMEFKVYSIIGIQEGVNRYCYYEKDYKSSNDVVGTVEKAQIYLSGSIKWDGCANLYFDEQDNVMLHFCSRKDIKELGILLDRLYDLAAEMMPKHKEYFV